MESNDHFPVVYRIILIISIVGLIFYGPQIYLAVKNFDFSMAFASVTSSQEAPENIESNTVVNKEKKGAKSKKNKKAEEREIVPNRDFGKAIDSFNRVKIYYNGSIRNVAGRNVTPDGYNLGLKYQCVEFVKRYYYEYFNHKMPVSSGHAKDYFDTNLEQGSFNQKRGLVQFFNSNNIPPKVNDIVVFGADAKNSFGHIAIVSKVGSDFVELVQQNVGHQTRVTFSLIKFEDAWTIARDEILGWLRIP